MNFNNTDKTEDNDKRDNQQGLKRFDPPSARERKPMLSVMPPKHPARVLVDIGLAASMQEAAKSAKLYDALLLAKKQFYKIRGRREPTEAEIDAERYPARRQHKGGRRHAQ